MLSLSLRPQILGDFVGQSHLIGEGKPLSNMLKNGNFMHCFFFGPPGCGKTTLARILAHETQREFFEFNATSLKIESLRQRVDFYKDSLFKPIIFIDEAHRLTKPQQEVLLPIMEDFRAIILGASTYNPYAAFTNAIRSRCVIFEFRALSKNELGKILESAAKSANLALESAAKNYIIDTSSGDARAALNLLDLAKDDLSLENLRQIRPFSMNEGTAESDTHYDLISAFIKSVRGSDENAAVYYLARLIAAGESADFIARRLVILASEDIGNANPNALNLATSAMNAVAKIGLPEARIILSQCAIYLAASPKANTAYRAIDAALECVKKHPNAPVPEHIKHFHKNYRYPHDFGGFVAQDYLPDEVKNGRVKNGSPENSGGESGGGENAANNGARFVHWSRNGFEKTLVEWLGKIRH